MSAPKPYTDADVELVAVKLHETFRPLAGDVLIFDDCEEIAKAALDALAEAGRLRSDEIWIIGTDYADDEIFGVAVTRGEAEEIRLTHEGDLPLHSVRYTVPYPSRPTPGKHTCAEKRGAVVIGRGDVRRCGCAQAPEGSDG